ncbi:predicted protein [Nematostella vectensis]|uniref:Potassium channel domain-containing protein n=1 Tax=Nematostella vectensis TaxID=45351 RepID=A7SQQ1_NEMVE|nr:potassium channel subfamily K member 3-like isoform X2 [Nematostella vectensis]EDO33950.1 predicted protein [Nematostella vectensis]|eukprot:XP_001626050.1 predicted protein [Nematostella vectensis]
MAKTFLIRITVLFVYSTLSAWLFYELEKQPVSNAQTADNMVNSIKLELKTKYNMSENATNRLVESVVEEEKVRSRPDWTFARSVFFVFVSLSTIGYGDTTPKRALTQLVFLLFCMLGLPIMMLTLKSAGEIIAAGLKYVIIFTEKHVFKKNDINARKLKLKTLILSMVISPFAIGIMAIVQSYIDEWTLIESVYAWMVTLTTIGFGDYVPCLRLGKAMEARYSEYGSITTSILMAVALFPTLFLLSLVACSLSCVIDAFEVLKPSVNLVDSCKSCCGKIKSKVTGNPDQTDHTISDNTVNS